MFWADVREIIAQIGFVNRVTTLKGFIYQSGRHYSVLCVAAKTKSY